MIAIGASAGGSQALVKLLGDLSASYPLPILLVKHHSAREGQGTGKDMVSWLGSRIALDVQLADDKCLLSPGTVYVAPPDYHLLLNRDGSLSLSQDEPVIHARPSVDVLFESVADAAGSQATGIILTGASTDGAVGAQAIRRGDGQVMIQHPETAEVPVMPKAALKKGDSSEAMELECLTARLLDLARKEPGQ
ncbi:chemotaxis protein CheB [Parendozoicomonas haliclonae]|uniref:chemotaxis protein CheB n=1 Tax=Parendozoicomonas haliclonae TaxID=1960125 RepID=UPI0013FD7049|nr:chemotaxis protein CheB [Parendozoicomonas haliclonae]